MTDGQNDAPEKPTRQDLTGEHRLGDAGQLIMAILFFACWIIDVFFLQITTATITYMPWYIRVPLGLILIFYGYYLARTGLKIVFGEVREQPHVIRKGVFNTVRHPIYLSEILVYLGLLIIRFSLAAFIVWLSAVGFLYYISRHEEQLLIKRFGDEYKRYMEEVPMLFPRFPFRRR